MARNAQQSQDYKFTVSQQAIIHNGKPTGFFGNFREDTGACLGMTSDQYGLVQNDELVDAAIAALHARGLSDFEQKVLVTGEGEKMFAEFTFKNKQLASAVGDIFGYKLILKNSFDRSTRAAFELALLRLTCMNGNSTLEKEFGVTAKHSGKVSVEFVGRAIDHSIENGQRALKVYDKLAEMAITDEQGQNILKQLEAIKLLSGSLRQSMETLWLAPKRTEDKARNLYNLYNAVTEHLTHQVSNERYEYSQKVGSNVLIKLFNAARNPAQLGKLILPIPEKDGVTISVDAGEITSGNSIIVP